MDRPFDISNRGTPISGGEAVSLLPSERRRRIKRDHIAQQVSEELASLWPWRIVSRLVNLLAIIALAAFIYTGFNNNAFSSVLSPQKIIDYGIVIDAGSHGTRLHLYSWEARIHDPDHPLSGPVTFPTEVLALTSVPGISDMGFEGRDPDQAGVVCIKPLLVQLMDELNHRGISADNWPSFPIFLKATGGMRNLEIVTRARIMNSIRRYLANDTEVPFAFHWNWARIIAGEEEGVYGWLTVNNALKTIFLPANQTVGAIDMGGASTQITFSPVHTSVIEGYYGVILGGHTIRLYSHSFLGYGWDDAMMRVTTRLGVETVLGSLRSQNSSIATTGQFLLHILGHGYNSSWTRTSRPDRNPESIATTFDRKTADDTMIPGDKKERVLPTTNITSSLAQNVTTTKIMYINATHPCYPIGHKFMFTLPSLVYPDGRFFLDLDLRELVQYMRSLGIPDEYLSQIAHKGQSPTNTFPSEFLSTWRPIDDRTSIPSDSASTGIIDPHSMDVMSYDNVPTQIQDNVNGDDFYSKPQASNAFLFHSNHEQRNQQLLYRDQEKKNPGNHGPNWLITDEESENVNDPIAEFDVSSIETRIPDKEIDERILIDLPQSKDEQDQLRKLKALKKRKQSSDTRSSQHLSKDGFSSSSPLSPTSFSQGPDSKSSFRPLDAPFPTNAAPNIQYVINFAGGSNFHECQRRARNLFYNEPCFIHSCSFNGVYQPRLEYSQFIAFGQFTKVQRALNISTRATPRQLETATREVCRKTKKQIHTAQNLTGAYEPYGKKAVLRLCWKALWSHTAIQWGYGFHENLTSIQFAQTVGEQPNQQAVGWTSGSMIYEVNTFPWKSPLGKFEIPFLLAAVTTILFVLATVLMALELRAQYRILSLAGLVHDTLKVTHNSDVNSLQDSGRITLGETSPGPYTQLP